MKQFVKFGIVGISNTIISYAIYILCLFLFQKLDLVHEIDYLIGSVIAFLLSVLWSFYWNNRFTFRRGNGEKHLMWKTLIRTYICYSITGLFLNNILLYVFVNIGALSKNSAPVFSLIITVPINFILNKFWAFR